MDSYNFEDVMLLPDKCVLKSRKDADTSSQLGKHTFKIPLMPANMPSIIDENIAIELARDGYFYVMHRFHIDLVEFTRKMKEQHLIASISIGVKEESKEVINKLKAENLVPEYITIDVAHGHSESMREMIEHIRKVFGDETFIIAGNVATPEAVTDLEEWGADATKVGIGPGYVCSTSIRTGFGTRNWQLMAVKNCADVANKVVIADGGLRSSGDIVKCIHFGADWVMSGYFFAGCVQSPTETEDKDGVTLKTYYGNASSRNMRSNSRIEGFSTKVPLQGTVAERLQEIQEDLQSAISYAGGTKMHDVRDVEHIFVNRSTH